MSKTYFKVYFTDYPYQESVCTADSLQDARHQALAYIRAWGLDVTIDRIEQLQDKEVEEYLEKKAEQF